MKRCLYGFVYFKSFFPTLHLWEDFQYLFHPICLQLSLNSIQLILNSSCIVMLFMPQFHITMNWCVQFQEHSKKFLFHKVVCYFVIFPMFLILMQIKRIYYMLQIVNNINLSFDWNSFILCYFNISCHVMMKKDCLVHLPTYLSNIKFSKNNNL
jgi:hypothetical protein